MILALLTGPPVRSRCTQVRSPFHPKRASTPWLSSFNGPIRFPRTPFQCPRSRTATLELGGRSVCLPALTWAWLHIEPSRRFSSRGLRLAGDPVDRDPDARAKLTWIPPQDRAAARWGLQCVTTPGSRRSCPGWAAAHLTWIFTVFTSLACYLDAFQDRWGLSSPYHVATTYPCGHPGSSSVRLTGGFCHADCTVPAAGR